MAGSVRGLIETPFEYSKVRRQTHSSWKLSECMTGFMAMWPRTALVLTTYVMLIDRVRNKIKAFNTTSGQFVLSGMCAVMAWWVAWPFEMIKN